MKKLVFAALLTLLAACSLVQQEDTGEVHSLLINTNTGPTWLYVPHLLPNPFDPNNHKATVFTKKATASTFSLESPITPQVIQSSLDEPTVPSISVYTPFVIDLGTAHDANLVKIFISPSSTFSPFACVWSSNHQRAACSTKYGLAVNTTYSIIVKERDTSAIDWNSTTARTVSTASFKTGSSSDINHP